MDEVIPDWLREKIAQDAGKLRDEAMLLERELHQNQREAEGLKERISKCRGRAADMERVLDQTAKDRCTDCGRPLTSRVLCSNRDHRA